MLCCVPIEWQNALFQYRDRLLKGLFEAPTLPSANEAFDPHANLEHSNCTYPNLADGLVIQPAPNNGHLFGGYKSGNNISIQNDHYLNFAGRGFWPLISSILNSAGTFAKSFIRRVPKPSWEVSLALTASRRITRASSSMLRPWVL